ncbi:predicted protein [Coccidioides posadasii str. Silveira]|uniref:Predicted protein n=1 Tax=Coccidioides posadasii (strain RMSCC 757 / Silveira) TaxID=443226 RepID=E9DFC6_COCPS|nr:predicted protein [Coccidioides posadasii str. Silveira]
MKESNGYAQYMSKRSAMSHPTSRGFLNRMYSILSMMVMMMIFSLSSKEKKKEKFSRRERQHWDYLTVGTSAGDSHGYSRGKVTTGDIITDQVTLSLTGAPCRPTDFSALQTGAGKTGRWLASRFSAISLWKPVRFSPAARSPTFAFYIRPTWVQSCKERLERHDPRPLQVIRPTQQSPWKCPNNPHQAPALPHPMQVVDVK